MLTDGMFIADRYEIINKIGAGGMSDVYKAKDHVLGRFVAIKVLKQEFSEDVSFVSKFHTEAQSAAGLEHPNIVNIYDVGSEDGMHYIVMEYIEGVTLKTYIEKKGQLSYKEAISIAIQVGRGIESAHNKNIVHRDIKPQNIMISTEGKVKVTDFGIARAATSNTIHSDVMGSVHYSSPEQARNGFIDGKSDIYSLGIVMYEMVTGRVPFDGDTTVAVAIQHLQEEMVPPGTYAKDLPISLEKIILKCTQKSPSRRYDTMGSLIADLKRSLATPYDDFISMVPFHNQDKTRVIEDEDVKTIKKRADYDKNNYDEDAYDESYDDNAYDDEADDNYDEAYDDEKELLNPKMEKAITVMGIVAAVVIVMIIFYLLGSFFGLFDFSKSSKQASTQTTEKAKQTETVATTETSTTTNSNQVTMIDVRGKTYDEAKAALNKIGLGIFKNGTQASDTYDQGQVATQSVDAGSKVDKNTTIKVVISSGATATTIPDVSNTATSDAQKKLEAAGFKVTTDYTYSSTIAQGNIVSTDPAAGTAAKKGDSVTMHISRGAQTSSMPNLEGQTQAAAVAALNAIGITSVQTTSEFSSVYDTGKVVGQNVTPGTQVAPGSSVTIAISKGSKSYTYSGTAPNYDAAVSTNPAKSATVTILDANGKKLIDSAVYSIGANISVTGITTPTGTMSVYWTLSDGSVTSVTNSNLSFTQSN